MIATNLKRLRESNGYSQRQLDRLAGLGNGAVHRVEAGKRQDPAMSTLVKLARALGVTVEELCTS